MAPVGGAVPGRSESFGVRPGPGPAHLDRVDVPPISRPTLCRGWPASPHTAWSGAPRDRQVAGLGAAAGGGGQRQGRDARAAGAGDVGGVHSSSQGRQAADQPGLARPRSRAGPCRWPASQGPLDSGIRVVVATCREARRPGAHRSSRLSAQLFLDGAELIAGGPAVSPLEVVRADRCGVVCWAVCALSGRKLLRRCEHEVVRIARAGGHGSTS